MTPFLAVYENGVLRPLHPLPLAEGTPILLTAAPPGTPHPYPRLPPIPSRRAPTPEDEEYARRLKAAKTLEELFAVMDTADPFPEDYDILKALEENRSYPPVPSLPAEDEST